MKICCLAVVALLADLGHFVYLNETAGPKEQQVMFLFS